MLILFIASTPPIVLQPHEGLVHHEDRQYGRGVEHADVLGFFSSVGAEVDHRRQRVHIGAVANVAEDALLDDDEGHASGADVLLGATVDEAVFLHVDGTAHDVGAHVSDEHDGAVHVVLDLSTVDGVVGRDVEVVGIQRDGVSLRDVGVGLLFGRGDDVDLTEQLGFLGGLLGPDAGLEVGGLGLHEVGGHSEELCAGTTTEEENFVLLRDVEEVAPQLTGLSHDALPTRGAVRNLGDTDTGVVEIIERLDGAFDSLLGQDARACVEIISSK